MWFDGNAAKVAIAFFSVLRHWKGEWGGRPIVLEPAQQFWIASLFGWKRQDGTRRFRTGYLEVGRKNAKTTTAAGIGLFLAFVEGEPGAEVYSAGGLSREGLRRRARDPLRWSCVQGTRKQRPPRSQVSGTDNSTVVDNIPEEHRSSQAEVEVSLQQDPSSVFDIQQEAGGL